VSVELKPESAMLYGRHPSEARRTSSAESGISEQPLHFGDLLHYGMSRNRTVERPKGAKLVTALELLPD
jgi:hypothetical protein